jgi:hypothetical protein
MNYPPEMTNALKATWVKKAWVSENKSPNPNDCPNCGGAGYLYASLASGGPFNSPPNGPAKSEIIGGQVKWWVVKNYSFQCPACAGAQAPRV